MKKLILLLLSVLSIIYCKNNKNTDIYVPNQVQSILEENKNNDILKKDQVVITENERITHDFLYYKIDKINVYETNDKESDYIEIINVEVKLQKLPEDEDWLYCNISEGKNGYINVYDISEESFYGNFEENKRSGNYYRIKLIEEFELIKKHSNIKRNGPLLEITYKNSKINIWDSFTGEMGHRYLLLDYFEKYDELFFYKQKWEGGSYFIYSLKKNDIICETGNVPYFNEVRETFFSFSSPYGSDGTFIEIFEMNDGIYEKVKEIYVPENLIRLINGYWINNNEFIINGALEEKPIELLMKRTILDFELIDENYNNFQKLLESKDFSLDNLTFEDLKRFYPIMELVYHDNSYFELKINFGP